MLKKDSMQWSMDRQKYGSKTSTRDQCCATMCTLVSFVPLQSMRHMFYENGKWPFRQHLL